jgi:glutamate-1-semialdehyde 2,1-aminomutase
MNKPFPVTPEKSYAESSVTHRLIPGGAHTYSKGDDQFPSNAPRYLERGDGVWVWDDKDRKYLDWTMGLRSMSLGYGIKAVNDAAIAQIAKGSNFGRPSFIETELAQDLVRLIPCADMVKYVKNGSSATSAAVKLARAFTGRDHVALCQDHPFFSYDDWFIVTTPPDNGIPQAERALSHTFKYGDLEGLAKIFEAHPGQIACVIMEAATTAHPPAGYLKSVIELAHKHGALFILDETITGFRWHLNGAQKYYGIEPDLATFGKGIANGFSLSVLAGKREVMELGGLDHKKKRVFLASTTHGAENHSLAAARAVLRIFEEQPVIANMWSIGKALVAGLNDAARKAGVSDFFVAAGVDCSPYFICKDKAGTVSMPYRTLFLQEMVKQGVLINYIAPSFSHKDEHVERTVAAANAALQVYARALTDGIQNYLEGPAMKPVFRPYN